MKLFMFLIGLRLLWGILLWSKGRAHLFFGLVIWTFRPRLLCESLSKHSVVFVRFRRYLRFAVKRFFFPRKSEPLDNDIENFGALSKNRKCRERVADVVCILLWKTNFQLCIMLLFSVETCLNMNIQDSLQFMNYYNSFCWSLSNNRSFQITFRVAND